MPLPPGQHTGAGACGKTGEAGGERVRRGRKEGSHDQALGSTMVCSGMSWFQERRVRNWQDWGPL